MKITYDEYDALQAWLEAIPNSDPGWLPNQTELDTYVATGTEKYLEFLLWLSFTASPDESEESKSRFRAINQILYREIDFLE